MSGHEDKPEACNPTLPFSCPSPAFSARARDARARLASPGEPG